MNENYLYVVQESRKDLINENLIIITYSVSRYKYSDIKSIGPDRDDWVMVTFKNGTKYITEKLYTTYKNARSDYKDFVADGIQYRVQFVKSY